MHFNLVFCEQKTDRLIVYQSFVHSFSQRQAQSELICVNSWCWLIDKPFFGQFYLYDTSAENSQCVCVWWVAVKVTQVRSYSSKEEVNNCTVSYQSPHWKIMISAWDCILCKRFYKLSFVWLTNNSFELYDWTSMTLSELLWHPLVQQIENAQRHRKTLQIAIKYIMVAIEQWINNV